MNWRPEGWINPHISLVTMKPINHEWDAYEDGADAMLKAVCEEVRDLNALNPYGGELASADHYMGEGWHRACVRLLRAFVVKETK